MRRSELASGWWAMFSRYQLWLTAAFLFAATWAAQEFLDRHLHGPGNGFGPGYLHFLRKLDHFLVFVGGGFLMAERSWLARCLFPVACAGIVILSWATRDWQWPWASNSMLLLLVLVASFLGWTHRRRFPLGIALALLGWLLLCHLNSECEFGAQSTARSPAFVAGLALTAVLSSTLGVVLGGALFERQTPLTRSVAIVFLLVVALALAVQ